MHIYVFLKKELQANNLSSTNLKKEELPISLLPDFFASRLPGNLDEIEDAVNTAGSCKSQEEAACALRPEITLPSALRWLRRRIKYVIESLTTLAGLLLVTG